MKVNANSTSKTANRAVANEVTQPRSNENLGSEFSDQRPEVVAQRQLRDMIVSSSYNHAAAQLKGEIDNATAGQGGLNMNSTPNDTGLPNQLKSGIEHLSGYAMDDVKVHYNSSKPAQLQAHAYAQGSDIYIASGQEQHLAHEAWHVVQQKQGRVKPTLQMKNGININDNSSLENEADVMGDKALNVQLQSLSHKKQVTPAADVSQLALVSVDGGKVRISDESADEGPYVTSDPLDKPVVKLTTDSGYTIYYNTITEKYTTKSRYEAVPTPKAQGELSAELSACVTLVRTNPGAIPMPAWVNQRVDEYFLSLRTQTFTAEARSALDFAWEKAKPHIIKDTTLTEAEHEAAFKTDEKLESQIEKAERKHDDTVNGYMRDKIRGVNPDLKFKWNDDFLNSDGDLPGDAGAGGYGEYYAKPDPSHAVSGGFWGTNRVIRHRVSGRIFTTSDHYTTYSSLI